jgi:GTPase SAR1 family protein
VAEDQQGLPKKLEKEIEDFFKQNPEQAGIFAARCALRVLPTCVGDDGRPLFSETPKKHFFAVIRSGVYAWLWRSPDFPSSAADAAYVADAAYDAYAAAAADAAYAAYADDAARADAADAAYADAAYAAYATAAADAAYAACAAYAADAYAADADAAAADAARAAAAAYTARAETTKYIEADFRAIQSGNKIQFFTLYPLRANESEFDVVQDDFSQKIQSLYGDSIASIYSCIVQGEEAAKNVFNNADQLYEYCESIWELSESGIFDSGDHQNSLSFFEFNNNDTDHKESTEEVSDHKVELTRKYIAGHKFSAETVSTDDYLNRQPLSDAIMNWLTEKENTSNINLALFGEWGVGKSTFLKMLINRDSENKASQKNKTSDGVHLIWGEFNAWRYEHSDNIQAGITQEAVKALKSQLGWLGRLWLTTHYAFKSYPLQLVLLIAAVLATLMAGYFGITETPDDFTSAAIAVGMPAQLFIFWFLYQKAQGIFSHPLADKLNTYLRLPSFGEHLGSIPVMRDQVALLTQLRFKIPSLIATGNRWWGKYRKSGKNQRLIFIVDDLDRCSPEGVVKTLEAIRLVMELDNVVVIVAIDQRVALASLAKHYEPLEKHHLLDAHDIARDYLAKVIHIPIVLEQPSENDIDHYLTNNLW